MVSRMELHQLPENDEEEVHAVRRDGGRTVIADFGAEAREAAVDVVDATAIVTAGDDQIDLELPRPAERAAMHNGVLTIELEGEA